MLSVGLMLCCCTEEPKREPFKLSGAWVLKSVDCPWGEYYEFPSKEGTVGRIYVGDSVIYECELKSLKSPNEYENIVRAKDVIFTPGGRVDFTLLDMDKGGLHYLENGRPKPLTVINDTTIVIQSGGVKHTWKKAVAMPQERIDEMARIIMAETGTERPQSYVFSSVERRLKTSNHILILLVLILILILTLIANMMVSVYRKKQTLELQLKQIREEHEQRPQPVRQAMKAVEEDFFCSDFYTEMRKKIAAGMMLRTEDWSEIEERLKPVYPAFSNRLYGLCRLSELEYHVCLLIKLRIAPSEIASVVSKDVSTISTVRSRLYNKVFGRKGSSKDWDDFVNSL